MIVSSVTSTPNDYLVTQRATNNLAANNLAAVNAQIAQDAQTNPADGNNLDASASDTVDAATVRATLDQRIAQDVASGTLSDSDAAAVRLTLDEIDGGASQTSATTSSQQSNTNNNASAVQASADNATVNGTAARTVLTQTVTIEGGVMTTVTFYSDGTQETTTTVATPEDVLNYGDQSQIQQQNAAQAAAQATATQYLATIEAGTLFNQLA
ncbi:hypothetical protein [Novosphingobium rosa]|uniref:hypothetical protein n=1 Tax=Novosphingobium rosa TaxID=76978 RepID=UPI000830540B|nr:hypothetical protein [Novosphingobium rosa]